MRLIIFDDQGPDSLGRRHFTLTWIDVNGIYRPEADKRDGKPVGFRRAQCFFANPAPFLETHTEVRAQDEGTP